MPDGPMIPLYDGYTAVLDEKHRGGTVFAPDGTPIAKTYGVEGAHAAAERHRKRLRAKVRQCLCCPRSFISEGPHNRLCARCREKEEGLI